MSFTKGKSEDTFIVVRKSSQEELDDLYEEFESSNTSSIRHHGSTRFCSDEFKIPPTPSTTRLNSGGGKPPTRLTTASAGYFRPVTSRRVGSRCGTARPITGTNGDQSIGLNRPLTAIRGAGYPGAPNRPKVFDPLNIGNSTNVILKLDPEETPIAKLRKLEGRIWELVDQSIIANHEKKLKKALELAKEAELKEKVLQKQEEEEAYLQTHDWELTFSVIFNLALQYEDNSLYADALNYYNTISTEKFAAHGPMVKLNIGNIFVKQRLYSKSIKVYRMALDQLGHGKSENLRIKLLQNIGLVLLQMKDYADAITSFETIMMEKPSFNAAFHLVVANYIMKDAYGSKTSFQELLQITVRFKDETCLQLKDDPNSQILLDVYGHDKLAKYGEEKRVFAEKCILTAARLIAPIVEDTLATGYDWVITTIRNSQHAAFSAAMEISKAVHLIKQGNTNEAISILQEFERKETKFLPAAASNLAFIYYLQGDNTQAIKYGEMAVSGDCYNEKSFVNLGNTMAAQGDLDRARTLYFEAFRLDSSSIEAMYNLGLVDQRLGHYDNALISFKKVLNLLPTYGDVVYQVALTYELMKNPEKAIEYYLKTLAINQHDSGVFKKVGINSDRLGDKHQAFCFYSDAFKYNPTDIFVVKWLAMYMIQNGLQDKAMDFLKNGYLLEPNDPLWLVSLATCQKQLGNTAGAIQDYKSALEKFPDNLEALEGLVELSKCLNKDEAEYYRMKLLNHSTHQPNQFIPIPWRFGTYSKNSAGTRALTKLQKDDSKNPSTPRNTKPSQPFPELRDLLKKPWDFDLYSGTNKITGMQNDPIQKHSTAGISENRPLTTIGRILEGMNKGTAKKC